MRTAWLRRLIALAFVADIALKIWSRQHPAASGRFAFWTPAGPIGIVPSVNDVLAFSLPVPNVMIWPVGWVIVAALIVSGVRRQASGVRLAILAIVLGAISNLIDRTFLGGVTDYLSLTDLFPAFNVADLLILSGIIAWVYRTRSTGETEPSEGKKGGESSAVGFCPLRILGLHRGGAPVKETYRPLAKAERASAAEGEVAQGNREVPL